MINTDVDRALLERFQAAGGAAKPCYVEHTVCWATSERRARKTAHEVWPLAGLSGMLFTELALPAHFEAAFEPITEAQVAEAVVCGPDARRHIEAIRKAERAGYTHLCVHQVGPEQEGFLDFFAREVLPAFGRREQRDREAIEIRTGRRAVGRRRAERRAPDRTRAPAGPSEAPGSRGAVTPRLRRATRRAGRPA
jgi:hypothetical protein